MARVDGEVPAIFMNPAVYTNVKKEDPPKQKKPALPAKPNFPVFWIMSGARPTGSWGRSPTCRYPRSPSIF